MNENLNDPANDVTRSLQYEQLEDRTPMCGDVPVPQVALSASSFQQRQPAAPIVGPVAIQALTSASAFAPPGTARPGYTPGYPRPRPPTAAEIALGSYLPPMRPLIPAEPDPGFPNLQTYVNGVLVYADTKLPVSPEDIGKPATAIPTRGQAQQAPLVAAVQRSQEVTQPVQATAIVRSPYTAAEVMQMLTQWRRSKGA